MELDKSTSVLLTPLLQGSAWDKSGFCSLQRHVLWHIALFFFFFTVLVNVPLWFASHIFGFAENGPLCLEYLLIGIAFLYLPRLLCSALLAGAVCLDLMVNVSRSFFLPLVDCLPSSGLIEGLPTLRLLAACFVLVLLLSVVVLALLLPLDFLRNETRRKCTWALVLTAVVCIGVDFPRYAHKLSIIHPHSAANSSWMPKVVLSDAEPLRYRRVAHTIFFRFRGQYIYERGLLAGIKNARDSIKPSNSALQRAVKVAQADISQVPAMRPNVVVILAESWGLAKDSAINSALESYYQQVAIGSRYQIQQGTAPFFGGTVAGEGRELCGSTIGMYLINASRNEMQGCLPVRMDALGYHSIAVHGLNPNMFDRGTWWSRIGFEEEWFYKRFKNEGLPDCVGAFTGTCDAAIANWISSRLAQPSQQPNFIYWVTLNTHLPLPVPSPINVTSSCPFNRQFPEKSSICSWFQLQANLHRAVAQLVQSPTARPTVFVIVGDHAPPFSSSEMRGQFSDTVVPYVIFAPRQQASVTHVSVLSGKRE
jgi:phosphoglycerol transferase MdoB-like AlkP superfamily enzyme